jgi:hypothetical protein
MSITKELYDEYVNKSFFTENNFSGRNAPLILNSNMIPLDKLEEFHYQTSFFLTLYTSLFVDLKFYESSTIQYNIIKFANTIENLQIKIDSVKQYGNNANDTYNISLFSSNIFTFYVNTFENLLNSNSILFNATGSDSSVIATHNSNYSNILSSYKPILSNINTLIPGTKKSNLLYINTDKTTLLQESNILDRTNSLPSIPNEKKILKLNTTKLKEIIEEILSQKPENILGYLLYKKIYYNIILYNISIQNSIRANYLNDTIPTYGGVATSSNIISTGDFGNISNCIGIGSNITQECSNLKNVNTTITNHTSNIISLNTTHFNNSLNNDYLIEKNKYINKISALNSLRDEYVKIQDKLNVSTKLYNQQYINYNSIKKYATYVIIALIIIVVSIIIISLFPIFSNQTKNAIYIILLILMIVITFLYYTNFKYVNLYEKFATQTSSTLTFLTSNANIISVPTSKNNIHKGFYNFLMPEMNKYANAYNELLNNMRININTIGSKSFSQDSNIYLYNLYLEKKRQIEHNKIKLTNLFNMIEIFKKQINYLFNIVFFISCFAIILLISLVIYSTDPHLYIFVIVLCVVLISILMIYFTFAIIQPTRMIANKNYWAIINPSKNTMGKL